MKRKKHISDLPLEERLRILGMGEPPNAEELLRRRKYWRNVDKRKSKMVPIDIPSEELVHMTPEEIDAKYGGT